MGPAREDPSESCEDENDWMCDECGNQTCDEQSLEVFICTAVQIILWLFAQVHCRAAFTLSSRLPLFVYTLQLTVLYVAGGDAMLTGEDEGETNTNSLVVQ